jgi:hypothetical protein
MAVLDPRKKAESSKRLRAILPSFPNIVDNPPPKGFPYLLKHPIWIYLLIIVSKNIQSTTQNFPGKSFPGFNWGRVLINPMCKVKITQVVWYPVRIQTSLLFMVPRAGGTALYLAKCRTYLQSLKNKGYDLNIKSLLLVFMELT